MPEGKKTDDTPVAALILEKSGKPSSPPPPIEDEDFSEEMTNVANDMMAAFESRDAERFKDLLMDFIQMVA